DLPHLPEEFPRAVRPHLEAVREVRDLVVAFSEEGLVREGIVDAVEEMLPEDDIIRLRRGRIVAVAVGLVVIVIGDRARRHDAVEKHVEVGVLPLDVLDPLHDVLEGDRLVVRVDPHDNPFLALRPHGPPLFGRPQDTVRFVPAYKDSSGVRPRVAERTSRPSSLALDCCMIMPSSRLNTLGTASDGDRFSMSAVYARLREAPLQWQ